jgi:hypothetical protein
LICRLSPNTALWPGTSRQGEVSSVAGQLQGVFSDMVCHGIMGSTLSAERALQARALMTNLKETV